MDLTVIITAYKEKKTVIRLIENFEKQLKDRRKFEILLLAPDRETGEAGLKASKSGKASWIKDQGRGKPAALNKGFNLAKGRILILTDGDVFLDKKAVQALIPAFKDKKIGAVTGRPKALNSRNNLFGFWAHLLTDAAHQRRREQKKKKAFLEASGYLMAIRAGLVEKIPEDSLADDLAISKIIWDKGHLIDYRPGAKVYVKFPTNFKDWLAQKKRTLGGHFQTKSLIKSKKKERTRGFIQESLGFFKVLAYPRNLKEFFWTVILILARLYLWLAVFWERRIINKSFEKTWARIESTKEI